MVRLLRTRHEPSVWATVLRVAFFLLLLSSGFVHSVNADVPPQNRPESSIARALLFAMADFDGDSRPDLASVEFGQRGSQNYAIDFRLTGGPRQSIDVSAPEGGLQLRVQDVNGDSFPDVVVTTFWTDQPVAVLLNDGRGNFTRSEPSAFPKAFEKSENLLTSTKDSKAEEAITLPLRYSPEPWEENAGAASTLPVVGRSASESFRILASPTSNSSLSRAPPSFVIHS